MVISNSRASIILVSFLLINTMIVSSGVLGYQQIDNELLVDQNTTALISSTAIRVDDDMELAQVASSGSGTVDDPYTIEGLDIGTSKTDCIYIGNTTKFLVISGCSLHGTDYAYSGIKITNSGNITIMNNNCSNDYKGIRLINTNNSTITDNNCWGYRNLGMDLSNSNYNLVINNTCIPSKYAEVGIIVSGSHNVLINNTAINHKNGGEGITLANYEEGSVIHDNVIMNNNCSNNTWGVETGTVFNTTISGNNCSYCYTGISASATDNSMIVNNDCFHCSRAFGIELTESDNNTIWNNDCRYNTLGLTLYCDCNNNTISFNEICYNTADGVCIDFNSDHNFVLNNTIHDNNGCGINVTRSNFNRIGGNIFSGNNGTSSVYDSSHVQAYDDGINYWNMTAYGNYWEDRTSPDVDTDGIVDLTYPIYGGSNVDNYPLVFEISIDVLPDKAYSNTSTATISGSVSFVSEISSVSWYNARNGASGSCTGKSSWEAVIELEEGSNLVYFDVAGNTNSDLNRSVEMIYDKVSPVVTIDGPSDGDYAHSVKVSWTCSDAISGIAGYHIILDGTSMATLPSSMLSYALILASEGSHTVKVIASDMAGNMASDEVSFIFDRTAPCVEIATPTDDCYNNTGDVILSWDGSDGLSGISYYSISIDDKAPEIIDDATGCYLFSDLDDGEHDVDIVAVDNAGNAASDTVHFITDTAKPSIVITSPSKGSVIGTTDIVVKWSANDFTSGIRSVELSLDGIVWSNVTGSSEKELSLSDGSVTLYLRTTDKAGNENETTVSFMIDTTDPAISITSPVEGSYNKTGSVFLSWEGNDGPSGIAYYNVTLVRDVTWTNYSYIEPTTLNRTFELADGIYTASVSAIDGAGNTATDQVGFIVDTTASTLIITSPIPEFVNTAFVSWTGNDAISGIDHYNISIDGETAIQVTADTSSYSFTGISDGPHTVRITAVDRAGNIVFDEVTFTLDTVKPTLSIVSPMSGSFNNTGSMKIVWSGSDDRSGMMGYEVSIDGKTPITVSSAISTYLLTGLSDGKHNVIVTAIDKAGNKVECKATYTVSKVPPSIEVSPLPVVYTNSTSLDITIYLRDAVNMTTANVTIFANGELVRSDRIDAFVSQRTVIIYPLTLQLTEGINVLHLSVNDSAGNSAELSYIVYRDTIEPDLEIVSPVTGTLTNSTTVAVSWTALDSLSGISGCYYSLDGGPWTDGIGSSHEFNGLGEGEHVVRVRATDRSGNYNETEVTFTIDSVSPSILSWEPSGNDSGLSSVIRVRFSERMNETSTKIFVNGVKVDIAWSGNNASFVPAFLEFNENYDVAVDRHDLAGNPVMLSWMFGTSSVGDIEGKLIDADGKAIVNATVTLSNGNWTVSDGNGQFIFKNVLIGAYNITVQAPGYESTALNVTVEKGASCNVGSLSILTSDDGSSDNDGSFLVYMGAAAIAAIAILGIVFMLRRK